VRQCLSRQSGEARNVSGRGHGNGLQRRILLRQDDQGRIGKLGRLQHLARDLKNGKSTGFERRSQRLRGKVIDVLADGKPECRSDRCAGVIFRIRDFDQDVPTVSKHSGRFRQEARHVADVFQNMKIGQEAQAAFGKGQTESVAVAK
jgi:hypothetical protein